MRGIARQKIFDDDTDRSFFVERFGKIVSETVTDCFAWALIPNHFHLLLKTGSTAIATVMKRLLTGYAMHYNRRHKRYGHLFQNRYKSILCQEETYLLELVRYIHLNPIRAKIVPDMKALEDYPYSGHGVLLGHVAHKWQDSEYILRLFDDQKQSTQERYRKFIEKGIPIGKRQDLTGGGLVRSVGGWAEVKSLRKAGALQKGDERILGDGEFVQKTLAQANEALEQRYRLKATGINIDTIAQRVADTVGIDSKDIWATGKQAKIVRARSLLCYWATTELGIIQVWLSRKLGLSPSAISQAVARGRKIVKEESAGVDRRLVSMFLRMSPEERLATNDNMGRIADEFESIGM
ncbi:MAG: transposase [Desulfobacterales bacterium]